MDLNSVNLVGRLTRDPELKYFGDDKAVAKFSVAVNGFKKEDVSFVDCEAWGKTAEFISRYTSKGCRVGITGQLRQDSWEAKDGGKRTKLLVNVKDAMAIDWAEDGAGQPQGDTPPRSPEPARGSVDSTDEPPF